ncbi:MAG: BatD family protein, partial [Opitutaceae bacterium]
SEAVAQAAAALVQRPGEPAIRRQFALACEKADISPGPLGPFIAPSLPYRLAELASPAGWEKLLVLFGWAAGAACVLLLLAGYRMVRAHRPAAIAGAILLGIAAAGIAAALLGRSAYGPAGDGNAVFLWRSGLLRSIPTEADASQETTPAGAGLIGVADRRFLGWTRIEFPNGQTGWLRAADVVPLWK